MLAMPTQVKNAPGQVRDAILSVLQNCTSPLPISEIAAGVEEAIGPTPTSSIRSYLRLNTPDLFIREERGVYRTRQAPSDSLRQEYFSELQSREEAFSFEKSTFLHENCFTWLENRPKESIHAVVTDPPYGLHEYTEEQQKKLRAGKGGVWRIPPSYDGRSCIRSTGPQAGRPPSARAPSVQSQRSAIVQQVEISMCDSRVWVNSSLHQVIAMSCRNRVASAHRSGSR